MGCVTTQQGINILISLAKQQIVEVSQQGALFVSQNDELVDRVFDSLTKSNILTIGTELIFGSIFDSIGFNRVKD